MVICKDKATFDKESAKKKLNKSLKRNYYWATREWPYKDVKPKIIAEEYMSNQNSTELEDYKLMCFNGEVKCSFVCSERFSDNGLRVTFYDRDWNRMPFTRHYPSDDKDFEKPKQYEKMIYLSEILSKDIPFIRTDFYEINDKIYFGELTFYPGAGMEEFTPKEWDYKLGSWLTLPSNN